MTDSHECTCPPLPPNAGVLDVNRGHLLGCVALVPACTMLWARWCPRCGACTCAPALAIGPNGCPLHDSTSFHIGPVLRREAQDATTRADG